MRRPRSTSAASCRRRAIFRLSECTQSRGCPVSSANASIAIRAGQSPDEHLVGRRIGESRWALYASRSYVERHGRPKRLEDVERHFVVALDGGLNNYPASDWLDRLRRMRRLPPAAIAGLPCCLL
ncbi:MAG: hypothetical protein JO141_17735 [Bradyrhizobium sp.]|nr:hypothetical protein [Bradyrhizobium sp.]